MAADIDVYLFSDSNINPSPLVGKTYYEKVQLKEYDTEVSNQYTSKIDNYEMVNQQAVTYRSGGFPLSQNQSLRVISSMDTSWMVGKNSFTQYIDKQGETVKTELNASIKNQNTNYFYSGFKQVKAEVSVMSKSYTSGLNFNYFNYQSYPISLRTETTEKLSNQTMVNKTEYQQAGVNPLLVSSQTTTNSLGETLKTEYEYPQDGTHWQTDIMNQMVQKNMISTPVITKTSNNGTPVSEQMTEYQVVNTNHILPHHVYAKKGSNTLEKKITYNSYDAQGNLTQYTMENGTPVSIIWGYNGQYPIAKVEGKTYTEITTLAQSLITDSNSTYGLEPAFFDNLRNLTGAVVTCYIYKPLVGVTTIIQPNGQKETYEYDGSGRLMHVKDHNGNILKKMDYHYKN